MENTVEKKMNSKEQVLLTKKDINKSFYRWYFDAEVANCYERQQGVAFSGYMEYTDSWNYIVYGRRAC